MQYLQKSMDYEIDFLPVDKHKNFLQIDCITLVVHGQACPRHPKQQLYNIFAISQAKRKGWSWFFRADIFQTFLQGDTVIFDVCGQTCPNYPQKRLIFLCNILREKWMMKMTFCMQVSMKTYYKLILWFWWRWPSISKRSQNSKFTMSVQYLKKGDGDEVSIIHLDNLRHFNQRWLKTNSVD